jgi:hypothetical protein
LTYKAALRAWMRESVEVGGRFELSAVYDARQKILEMTDNHPSDHGLKAYLRYYLQRLRDDGDVAFVDRGVYRRLR